MNPVQSCEVGFCNAADTHLPSKKKGQQTPALHPTVLLFAVLPFCCYLVVPNVKIVVDRITCPGFSSVEGNAG